MWKRLAVLWTATAAVIYFLFFYRIETHAVKLDMPANGAATAQQTDATINAFVYGTGAVILFVILGVLVWLNFRIIRSYRKSG